MFLTELEDYIPDVTTTKPISEEYSLIPIDYTSEEQVSFVVNDGDSTLATIKIKKVDGTPVDAVNDTYSFAEVYGDIDISDEADKVKVKEFIIGKLRDMGYVENPLIIDGEEEEIPESSPNEDNGENEDEDELVMSTVKDIDGDFSIDDLDDYAESYEKK
jgi:hypothetical protein